MLVKSIKIYPPVVNFFLLFMLLGFIYSGCSDTQPCVDINNVDPTLLCTNEFNPVCGCDNITYQNECLARQRGVVAWIGGPCP